MFSVSKRILFIAVIDLTAILPFDPPRCLEVNSNCSRVPNIGGPGFPPFPPYVSYHHVIFYTIGGISRTPLLMSEKRCTEILQKSRTISLFISLQDRAVLPNDTDFIDRITEICTEYMQSIVVEAECEGVFGIQQQIEISAEGCVFDCRVKNEVHFIFKADVQVTQKDTPHDMNMGFPMFLLARFGVSLLITSGGGGYSFLGSLCQIYAN